MTISGRIRSSLIAFVASASALAAVPVSAAPSGLAVNGAGTPTPALAITGGAQTFSFSGNGAGTVRGQTGAYSCSVNGNDTIGTITDGAGGFSGTCNTPCGTVGVSGGYVRTAGVVNVMASTTTGCLAGATINGDCGFLPTSGPTVTSYALACELSFGPLPDVVTLVGTGTISPGLTGVGLPPTSYAVDSVVIAGTGTISPGLTTTGGAQTFSFSGNGGGSMGGQDGGYSCSVNGNDTIGTTTQGYGSFSGSCNTPCGAVGVRGDNYTRAATRVQVFGAVTTGCLAGHNFVGECLLVPTSGPTITSYALTCEIGFYVTA
ncbi:MAG: hypothetical protein QOC82_3206 [Frankiaceae bacterium]|jgi:hypothetical protein|nr:hypothetical protein [Frankiaceae bacterium]